MIASLPCSIGGTKRPVGNRASVENERLNLAIVDLVETQSRAPTQPAIIKGVVHDRAGHNERMKIAEGGSCSFNSLRLFSKERCT